VTLYSYVVARDYGFAPNPFFGVCTLATCKPLIRRAAQVGDWVVGTGSKGYKLDGRVVFAMKVAETLTFDEYWSDPRFRNKRPNLHGSLKQAFGDNIYHRNRKTGRWVQMDSHHSHRDGTPNSGNIRHDAQAPRVLIGIEFSYWGGKGPKIPARFRNFKGADVCAHRGHKNRFPEGMAEAFIAWLQERGETGFISPPAEF
jgi:hypothetical protein